MKNDEYAGRGHFYEYGVRGYDARTARFQRVDPLTQRFPWYTPYQFAGNSPIANIDLDGAEPLPAIIADKGKTYGEGKIKRVYGSSILGSPTLIYNKGNDATYEGWYYPNDYSIVSGEDVWIAPKLGRAVRAGMANLGHMNDIGWSLNQQADWNADNIQGSSIRHANAASFYDAAEAGGKTNAFNHAIWQGLITIKYGWMAASLLGDAHEENPYLNIQRPYTGSLEFNNLEDADSWVDLQNNHLIRDIMKDYKGSKTVNGVALYVLDYYKNHGLWVLEKLSEDQRKPILYKLNDNEYEKARYNVQNLDDIYK